MHEQKAHGLQWAGLMGVVMMANYHIAGNFLRGPIFVVFVDDRLTTKIKLMKKARLHST